MTLEEKDGRREGGPLALPGQGRTHNVRIVLARKIKGGKKRDGISAGPSD